MSGVAPDPLDRIEEIAADMYRTKSEGGASMSLALAEVEALVEVARAARPFAEPFDTNLAQYDALRAALARLDKDTA